MLYVALTRTTKYLTVLHTGDPLGLPDSVDDGNQLGSHAWPCLGQPRPEPVSRARGLSEAQASAFVDSNEPQDSDSNRLPGKSPCHFVGSRLPRC